MKRVFILLCCIVLILWAVPVFADEESPDVVKYAVRLQPESFACLGPGDILEDTFYIHNQGESLISVRLCDVRNRNQSPLYDVLQTRWIKTADTAYGRFDELVTDWIEIPSNQSMIMNLEIYFPKELGNAFQGKELNAEFVFLCCGKGSENVWIDTGKMDTEQIQAPNTGDINGSLLIFSLINFSFAVILLRRIRNEI